MKKFIVFLDSNIYDAANYSFGNPQFSKLSELIYQDHVTLLINSVVEGEVKKHIKERMWKVEVEKEEVHRIAFELTLNIDIENFSDDIALEDLEVIVEGHEDGPSRIDLNEATFVSGEVVSDNYRDDKDDYSSGSGVCPDCGEKLTFETDALTGFCTTCSPNH